LDAENKHKAVIQAIDFHKNNSTVLTAGLDKTLKLFNLAKSNESDKFELRPLKSLFVKNLPIVSAQFNCLNNEVIASGMKEYILSFDLAKETFERSSPSFITDRLQGKIKSCLVSPDEKYMAVYGHNQYLMMVHAKTKQLLYEFRLNSEISSCSFSQDQKYVFASTEDGSIYQWDLGTRKIVDFFQDSGSLKTNCIDFSQDGNYMISGNSVGMANLYEFNKMTKSLSKTPVKEIDNLTTSLDNVAFNPDSEIACITSKWKKNAIRLVHLPSFTVFSNWPNLRTKIGIISKVRWSKDSRYLAIGNDMGNLIVYNFEHYN
jgi:U3 small nucleolar RNA-associated protein 18